MMIKKIMLTLIHILLCWYFRQLMFLTNFNRCFRWSSMLLKVDVLGSQCFKIWWYKSRCSRNRCFGVTRNYINSFFLLWRNNYRIYSHISQEILDKNKAYFYSFNLYAGQQFIQFMKKYLHFPAIEQQFIIRMALRRQIC